MKDFILKLHMVILLLFSSCSPVNYFTRIKKTPRVHAENLCAKGVKAPKSGLTKKEWIVYSDRKNNVSTLIPGGRVKSKELKYLEPLLVIKEKDNYLKLIKYDPKVIKNGKLEKYKEAEYYGWIHKSKLLLENQSITDVKNRGKYKSILAISDSIHVSRSDAFFESDSVITYLTPRLQEVNKKASLYDIVYVLKRSADRDKVLISKAPYLDPESIQDNTLGWVSASLVKNIGQHIFVDYGNNMNNSNKGFVSDRPNSLKYSPFIQYYKHNSKGLNTCRLSPLIDRSENSIFNVKGDHISFRKKKKYEEELKKINISFVIEPGEHTIQIFPALMNSLQNIGFLFKEYKNNYSFKFSSVVISFNDGNLGRFTTGFTSDFNKITEDLMVLSRADFLQPIPPRMAWKGVSTVLDLIEEEEPTTNVVIVLGETGKNKGLGMRSLAKRAGRLNCRLFGFQLYAGVENDFNNFVIQFSDMINEAAGIVAEKKQDKIVYSEQLRDNNAFAEVGKNSFWLDFPKNSMTQGGVSFPEKNQFLSLDHITNSTDSFLIQVLQDNKNLTESIEKAFLTVGSYKDKLDASYISRFQPKEGEGLPRNLKQSFKTTYPYWFSSIVDTAFVADSTHKYQLLFSEKELEKIRSVIDGIAEIELDKRVLVDAENEYPNTSCDCLEESPLLTKKEESEGDSTVREEYVSTKKARKRLKEIFEKELQGFECCSSKRKSKRLTLAQIHEKIFKAPTYTPVLKQTTLRSLTKKKLLPDEQLDSLLNYYKVMKKKIDKKIDNRVKFSSSGISYYWVNANWLP